MTASRRIQVKGDGQPSPFLIQNVPFETPKGIEHISVEIDEHITLRTLKRIIVIHVSKDICKKICAMIEAYSAHEPQTGFEPDLPLNCRSTAQWLMRGDKSTNAETGQECGIFMSLQEAKKKYGYPLGVEWSTGNRREDVTPFHEGVILGPIDDDELIFEKPGYSLPYQFSLLSTAEARNVNMAKNKHNLRSFYGQGIK